MEHIVDRALDAILSQGGLSTAFLIVACGVIVFLWRTQAKMSAVYEKKLDEVHAARITELRDVISTQDKSSAAVTALSISIDTRTTAFVDLSGNVALMAQSIKAFQDAVMDQLARLERDMDRGRR